MTPLGVPTFLFVGPKLKTMFARNTHQEGHCFFSIHHHRNSENHNSVGTLCCEKSKFKYMRTDCRAKRRINLGAALFQTKAKTKVHVS